MTTFLAILFYVWGGVALLLLVVFMTACALNAKCEVRSAEHSNAERGRRNAERGMVRYRPSSLHAVRRPRQRGAGKAGRLLLLNPALLRCA